MKNNNFKYGKIIKNANNDLEAVNISDGNYCANGVLTNITVYDGECDSSIPSYPSVAVDNTDYEISKTYILTPPSVISGIARYEYYLSESSTTPGSDVTVSGTSLSNEITINVNATYIFFRVVSVAGLNGLWTNNKTNYVDNTNPTGSLTSSLVTSSSVTLVGLASDENSGITKYEFSKDGTNYVNGSSYTITNIDTTNPTISVSVSGKVGTITLGDNLLLSGYTVTTSATVPTVWTSATGTSKVEAYTASTAGTYYAWVRDQAGNTAYSSFVIASTAFCAYTAGSYWNFGYNGAIQTFTVPCSGIYKLEVWGAQGGNVYLYGTLNGYSRDITTVGGLGGYSTGSKTLTSSSILYVVVGGQAVLMNRNIPNNTQTGGTGGYNGGGTSTVGTASGGGGATHIATATGVLTSLTSTRDKVLLVAGGGGGSGYIAVPWISSGSSLNGANLRNIGGTGGGLTGQDGQQVAGALNYGAYFGTGGTQTTGYAFGIGANGTDGGAGGGGWYGGGSGGNYNGSSAGGGGSGYLSSTLTSTSMTNGVRTGNGYALITLVSVE